MISKKEIRKEILARRDALSSEERKEKSSQICRRIAVQEAFQRANKILLFASFKSEVDTAELLKEAQKRGKEIYYPRIMDNEMEFYLVDKTTEFDISRFGIKEPKPEARKRFVPQKADKIFMLMPGAAFDKEGNRIGYGGGYYDRYLQRLEDCVSEKNINKIAVAFECQMVENGRIPKETHDILPNCIVTESQILKIQEVLIN